MPASVAARRDHLVENVLLSIHRTPKPARLAADPDLHLIDMPQRQREPMIQPTAWAITSGEKWWRFKQIGDIMGRLLISIT